MNFTELNKKIAEKNFKNIYFFYGDENYLKDFYCDKIVKTVIAEDMAGFNLFTYKEAVSPDELISAIEQPPMMSEYKICFLNNIDLKKADQIFKDVLIKAFSDIPEYTILIIKEAEVDKRSKIFTEAKKYAEIIECNYPSPQDMRAFVGREFSKRGKKISTQLADKIAIENEKSMYSVISLIDTVSAYLQDTEIVTEESISKFLNKAIDAVIFDLSDALVNFQKKRAFEILNELKLASSKNPPQVMFSLLARHIMCLYICLINSKARVPNSETAKLLGKNTPEFVVSKYLRQTGRLSEQKLESLILFCADTDFKLKTGQISDPFMGIYTLFALFWQA